MEGTSREIVIGRIFTEPEMTTKGNCKFMLIQQLANGPVYRNVISTGKQASIVHDKLKKGDLCCVEGKTACDERKVVSLISERITFMGSRS